MTPSFGGIVHRSAVRLGSRVRLLLLVRGLLLLVRCLRLLARCLLLRAKLVMSGRMVGLTRGGYISPAYL